MDVQSSAFKVRLSRWPFHKNKSNKNPDSRAWSYLPARHTHTHTLTAILFRRKLSTGRRFSFIFSRPLSPTLFSVCVCVCVMDASISVVRIGTKWRRRAVWWEIMGV
jgi:hypothetical protein